jgi:hypothetical protein
MLKDLLQEVIDALELNEFPYMVSGSFAMSAYAVPRMTRDIDVVIDLDIEDIDKFLRIFAQNFHVNPKTVSEEIQRRGMFNVIDERSGYKIDFVVKKNSPYRKLEFERRRKTEVMGIWAWMVSAEDLILSKIIWIQEIQSDKQAEDIRNLKDLDLDWAYINRWINALNLKTFGLIP